MSRYFIEVCYKGTRYSGFQIQENSNTVQAEVENAFNLLHRLSHMPKNQRITLTGSSRTDAGVHALQNFFHFDFEVNLNPQFIYKMNSILPPDIAIVNLYAMPLEAHSRFDALSREYLYRIYTFKEPFKKETAYYFPYKIDIDILSDAAHIIKNQTNFFSFSKTNTQVNNFNCSIYKSEWEQKNGELIYNIEGSRFLRGMVRSLTAIMLQLARGKITLQQFKNLFSADKKQKAGVSVPAHGLFLKHVKYPPGYFEKSGSF